jgi:UDP-N-acetylmuramoyl-tripeptide--D-alanyl-D-alanine ligase
MKVSGRKIAALGSMFELGDKAPELHKNLSKKIRENNIDLLFSAGDLMQNLFNAIPEKTRGYHVENSAKLGAVLANSLKTGDAVLIKGSRGMNMENIINFLQE